MIIVALIDDAHTHSAQSTQEELFLSRAHSDSFNVWVWLWTQLALLEAAAGKLPVATTATGSEDSKDNGSSHSFFDFFSVMGGAGARGRHLRTTRGDALVLNVAAPRDAGTEQEQARRMAGTALSKALGAMTTTVLLPRRHGVQGSSSSGGKATGSDDPYAKNDDYSIASDNDEDVGGVGLTAGDAQLEALREIWVKVASREAMEGTDFFRGSGGGDDDLEGANAFAEPLSWDDMYTKVAAHFEILAAHGKGGIGLERGRPDGADARGQPGDRQSQNKK